MAEKGMYGALGGCVSSKIRLARIHITNSIALAIRYMLLFTRTEGYHDINDMLLDFIPSDPPRWPPSPLFSMAPPIILPQFHRGG